MDDMVAKMNKDYDLFRIEMDRHLYPDEADDENYGEIGADADAI